MALSIRWRLTLWNTLALALVLLAFAALVYGLVARLDRRRRSGLRRRDQDRRLGADPAGRLRHWADELQEHEGVFCVVYGAGGEVRARTEQMAADSVPAAPAAATGGPRLRDAA